jgi:hypothetical protein
MIDYLRNPIEDFGLDAVKLVIAFVAGYVFRLIWVTRPARFFWRMPEGDTVTLAVSLPERDPSEQTANVPL